MTEFCPLFSGSSGNACYIKHNDTALLVDAGVSGKKIEEAISAIEGDIKSIKGILVTHEHSDHINAVGILSRRYKIPVFATKGTFEGMSVGEFYQAVTLKAGQDFEIGSIKIKPFSIPHDASEPVGYNFYAGKKKITIATDIGAMSEALFVSLSGSHLILLESNHDKQMLLQGVYPLSLKRRIAGDRGHLSNEEAALCAARLVGTGTTSIILGHLSGENNIPSIAYNETAKALEKTGVSVGKDVRLCVARATQNEKIAL